jgi:predicted Zn finger-like uncharacterized protein
MPEQIRCPSCNATLRVPDTLLGKNVKCPKCQTTFTAATDAPEEPEEGIVHEPAPAARRRPAPPPEEYEEEAPPEEEYEEEDRPRRRRKRGRRTAAAASAVAGPAISLMALGGLAIALCVLGLLLNLLGVGLMAAAPKQGAAGPQSTNVAVNAITGVGSAIFGLVYWSLVTLGAVKMKNLSSYGFAMTSCILAMLPCSLCCILGLPFGIWGIVVLNKPEVKEAFS